MIRTLLHVLALLCLFGTASAQNELEARLDAVREFKTYMKKLKEEAQQVEAVMTLQGNECPQAAEELLKQLKHKSPAVQKAALDVLQTYRDPATFQAWLDELPELRDNDQIATLVMILGQSQVQQAVPAIEAVAADPKAATTVKYEAVRALRRIGDPGQQGLIGRFLGDDDGAVRMAAADAVAALKLRDYTEQVIALLEDSEWQVQSAAITACGQLRPQAAIQPLITLMRQEGRLQIECADALFLLFTVDFGVDPDRWQGHWDNLSKIPGWRIPTDEEVAKAKASRKKYDELYGKTEGRNKFAGIPTTSTNVLFIIDQSGSMEDLVVEVEKFEGYRDRKRFTIVQTELINTIDGLTADTNFDIVAFASDLKVWKKRLVPANIVNRESAKSWVGRLQPLGGSESQELAMAGLGGAANLAAGKTNTLKALMYPFGIDPANPPKAAQTGPGKTAMKSKLDTVYFLSDGRPSTGVLVDTNEILKEVRRYNEVYRIVIHTIAIGDFQKEFLRDLARDNGGEFIDMGR
ncbi:MAG: HEAT repeat domain-containing protein [Planctomycetes bacterium]|nr:HEAT repeat domain-containing protein [Planctomycetota bacterium]